MKKFLSFLVLLIVSLPAQAMDHRSQFGVGGALGGTIPAPWASNAFRNSVSAGAPAVSAYARYIPGTPEVGLELSYNHFSLGKQNIRSNTAVFSFISRQNPWGNFHPFYGFGVGYSRSDNWFTSLTWEAPVYKLIVGIEFEINDHMDFGFHLDHYSIFKNKATEQNLHVITPMVNLTWYLGKPAPLPPAPAPAPAPTVAPAPPAAAPAVAEPEAPVISPEKAFEKLKPSTKGATKPKAPAKPKKKKKKGRSL
ncbi:MAG TPA: hypothetical protein VIH99_00750 [Bdellovibrionota bacterium]|jgi:hypothetical protein